MTRSTLHRLRTVALATLVPLLLAISATPVRAEPIPQIERPVTDLTGALSDSEAAIEDAIERSLDDHGVQVWVVFVRSTDELPSTDYADETARLNSLGGNDALLLVAIDDRTDAIWVADGLEAITDREIDDVIVDELEPRLADGDFGGAVIAAVDALGEANTTAAEPTQPLVTAPPAITQPPATAEPGGTTGGSGIGLGTILVVGLIVVGGVLVYRGLRSRSASEERDRRTGELAREANARLISTDERIRDAVQEIGFVEAQYGPSEVAPLQAAVAAARDELRTAFTIRQKLDDSVPEDPPTREAMLREIVDRTTRAEAALDEQTERIRALRDLERDAPQTLAALPEQIATQEARISEGEAALEAFARYAPSSWQPVAGNVVEARKGLAGARAAVAQGNEALARGNTAEAAVATRTALEGVTGAAALFDGVDRLAEAIRTAEARIPLELGEAEKDLADARAAAAEPAADPQVAARLAAAERAIEAAKRGAAAARPDPVAALSQATDAHRLADEALLAVREEAAARERLVAAVDSSIRTATLAVDRASDYIASRRRGVGRAARTRLAEAERHLADATTLQGTDPKLSLQAAGNAERLANEAYRLAGDDFSDWDQGGPGWGQRRGGGSDVAGAVLGGIIGGILSGGTGGGGWGGSPWGGSGHRRGSGGFPGWGGGGGFGSGGFGGGGGGGLGGGGGRSRGGRW